MFTQVAAPTCASETPTGGAGVDCAYDAADPATTATANAHSGTFRGYDDSRDLEAMRTT